MGRTSHEENKERVLRVRITASLDDRIDRAMVAHKYQGEKSQFCAWLTNKGLDLVEFEHNLTSNAMAQMQKDAGLLKSQAPAAKNA